MAEEEKETGKRQANPGYALFQIAKAFTTNQKHEDAATRQRAQAKIDQWTAVINGMLNGTVDVGSRTPVAGIPGWATLEVVTGGFATGELLAGGPLLAHEQTLLAEIASHGDLPDRQLLNAYHLTEAGLARLREQLRTGRFEVAVPEEGALLVVAWLVQNGQAGEARNLLDELAPFFPQLRFYPIPSERPRQFGSRVYRQDVGKTINSLREIQTNQRILAQKEAIQVWLPLYDEIVRLFLETVEGEMPNLQRGPNGEQLFLENGKYPVVGGWPCQKYPPDWTVRAQKIVVEYKAKRAEHKLCGRPERSKDSFAQLYQYLQQCIVNPTALSGRDVGRIRLILARYVAKRGAPDSAAWQPVRAQQKQQASGPTFHQISRVVITRLAAYPAASGLDDLADITQPITGAEAARWQIQAGTPVPVPQQKKIRRCLRESVDQLVALGVITSGETLAQVLPQITSEIRAAGIVEPALRQLYAAIYRAFRRRRSLLLLNLESQIKLEELPWVAVLNRFRDETLSSQQLARQTLEEVTRLAIVSFPQAILPNKLLQELRALAKGAGLDLPLVDEVAADIFMGKFTDKFLEAAKQAGNMLEGTLYEIYYGIDYQKIQRIPAGKKDKKLRWPRHAGSDSGDAFVSLCAARAGVTYAGYKPAVNGMIIEQQQIYTSQNLAVLFAALDLKETLAEQLEKLAQSCFIWICRRLQVKTERWHARLIMVKNAAYAWRQMIFFLSLLPPEALQTFLVWAETYLKKQDAVFQTRFRPAWQGLLLAASGTSLDDEQANRLKARRFLGWSVKEHWLLAQDVKWESNNKAWDNF